MRRGSFDVIARALSAARARRYLDRDNRAGGCTTLGSGGSLHRLPTHGAGLPKGSGVCHSTGYRYGGQPVPDAVSGVTRTKAGQWLSVDCSLAPGSAASRKQVRPALRLLRRIVSDATGRAGAAGACSAAAG